MLGPCRLSNPNQEDNTSCYQSINQSLLRQKAAHAETHTKNKHKLQTKLTAIK